MNLLVPHGFESNYTLGFAKGLAANGIPLFVLSSDDTEARLTTAGIENKNIRGSQSTNRSFGAKIGGLTTYYLRLFLYLFRHRGETIHFSGIFRNDLILFEGVFLHLFMRLAAKKYIYTAHNILPHNRQGHGLFRWLYRYIYWIPTSIVVHTEGARMALLQEFGVRDEKIEVISIGLNEEIPVTAISRDEARTSLGYEKEDKLILFFGRIDEYKGLHLLIEAFSKLDLANSRLLASGEVRNTEYGIRIKGQIKESPRLRDMRLDLRLIPNDEVEVLFKAADVLCLPYLNITQSGLIFLAARFGIPVLATSVGSMATFVTPETGLVTKTNDALGLAAGLLRIFASMENYPRERIRKIGQKFAWDRICVDLIPLYEQRMSKR
jgi:glycosyltransferase involved in cell wall biosynthesis